MPKQKHYHAIATLHIDAVSESEARAKAEYELGKQFYRYDLEVKATKEDTEHPSPTSEQLALDGNPHLHDGS